MAETADYDPGPWKGYDFKSARNFYDAHAGRSYSQAKSQKKTATDLIAHTVRTNCRRPLIVACDVTGSMKDWPSVIFSKLPYLAKEGSEYLGDDLEICWTAIGDANTDTYPLQVRPFTKGLDLKEELEKLVIEGNGGGQVMETYELAALYFLYNATFAKNAQPIIIFIGDEKPYPSINPDQAQSLVALDLERGTKTDQVFAQLKEKFSVYLVRKPYESVSFEPEDDTNKKIRKTWEDLLGADHIANLSSPDRVVDVIFGILAQETDRVAYFEDEIEGRQKPDQIEQVYKSLESVHLLASHASGHTGKSTLRHPSSGPKSRPLL